MPMDTGSNRPTAILQHEANNHWKVSGFQHLSKTENQQTWTWAATGQTPVPTGYSTTEHTRKQGQALNLDSGDWRPYLQAGCWRRRAGDGGGAEGDDAAVSPVTGSAPPSPAQCSARVPPSAAGCLVRVVSRVCLGVRCSVGSYLLVVQLLRSVGSCLLVVQLLLTWWESGKGKLGWAAGQVKWATGPKFQSSQPG
jgi:hypothetical protein